MTSASTDDRARWRAEGSKLLPRYHLTDTPCPKCGAPTLTDQTEAWLACMFFDDGSFKPAMQPGFGPPKGCDYGEWR